MIMKVIKPTNKYKDDDIYHSIVSYCLNPSRAIHGHIAACNLDVENMADDMYQLTKDARKLKGTRIRHTVISFHPKQESRISPEVALTIAQKACEFYEDRYQIFGVVHENKAHLHFHLIMNTVGMDDGKKYTGRKKDYYDFQKHLKNAVREYGLKLELE